MNLLNTSNGAEHLLNAIIIDIKIIESNNELSILYYNPILNCMSNSVDEAELGYRTLNNGKPVTKSDAIIAARAFDCELRWY